jgi:YD repeat-containing protein
MIASCGKDLSPLETKADVRAQLGDPVAIGVEDGAPFEEYRTRRKISRSGAPPYCGPGYAMLGIMTCGTVELILVPYELYLVGSGALLGQRLRFTYDTADRVTRVTLDGEPLFFFKELHGDGAPTDAQPAASAPLPAPAQ